MEKTLNELKWLGTGEVLWERHANVGHLNLAERLGKGKSKTDSGDQ